MAGVKKNTKGLKFSIFAYFTERVFAYFKQIKVSEHLILSLKGSASELGQVLHSSLMLPGAASSVNI